MKIFGRLVCIINITTQVGIPLDQAHHSIRFARVESQVAWRLDLSGCVPCVYLDSTECS